MRGRQGEPYALDEERRHYVTPAYYELVYGRNHRTVRDWIRQGKVRSMWSGDVLYVHLADCRKMDVACAKQDRQTKESA